MWLSQPQLAISRLTSMEIHGELYNGGALTHPMAGKLTHLFKVENLVSHLN
jgi:hypothetical protein